MEIILKEDIVNLGYKNDIVTVKSGYGRNYLIPTGKAVIASPSAKKMLADRWSAGVAWNLHNEPFLRDQDVLKQFKIRASAGLTGNQNYDTNEVLATYLYYTGATYHGQTGAYLSKMPNPALKWEQRMDYNVGADITVHRATIAFDYYNSVTENMLTDVVFQTFS